MIQVSVWLISRRVSSWTWASPDDVHDLEEKDELEVMAAAVARALSHQSGGDVLVGFDEVIEPGKLEQLFRRATRPGVGLPGDGFQGAEPGGDLVVGDVPEQVRKAPAQFELGGFAVEPLLGVALAEPVEIGLPEVFGEQPVERRAALGPFRAPGEKSGGHAADRIETAHEKAEVALGETSQFFKGGDDDRPEPLEVLPGILQDLVEVEQQVVDAGRFDVLRFGGLDGVDEDVHHQRRRLRPLGVLPEEVEILERVLARLGDDEAPVHVGVGEFAQEGRQPLHQPVIALHDLLERGVFRVDGDVDVVVGEVDFQGF